MTNSPEPSQERLSEARLEALFDTVDDDELVSAITELRALRDYKLPCAVKVVGRGLKTGTIIGKGCPLSTLKVAMANRARYDAEEDAYAARMDAAPFEGTGGKSYLPSPPKDAP